MERIPTTCVATCQGTVANFMLACMAEGKVHEEEDEEPGHRRNHSLYCKLSMQEVNEALDFQAKKSRQTAAEYTHDEERQIRVNARVLATAEVVLKLATETALVSRTMAKTELQLIKAHCQLPKQRKQ